MKQAIESDLPVKVIIWLNFGGGEPQQHKCVLSIFNVGKNLGEIKLNSYPNAVLLKYINLLKDLGYYWILTRLL